MKTTPIIAPSILSANFACLGEEVQNVLAAGGDWVHIDVMDHHYVPNLTFGPLVCDALRNYGIKAPLDVHLMVEPVDPMIASFAKAGASYISFHPEASRHVHRTIQLIKDNGCKAGLVLNPATPTSYLDYVLPELDLVLVMSVNPGFGGQHFLPSVLPKIETIRKQIDALKLNIRLSVDGGIQEQTIAQVATAGADTFVAGSAIFKCANYSTAIQKLRGQIKG